MIAAMCTSSLPRERAVEPRRVLGRSPSRSAPARRGRPGDYSSSVFTGRGPSSRRCSTSSAVTRAANGCCDAYGRFSVAEFLGKKELERLAETVGRITKWALPTVGRRFATHLADAAAASRRSQPHDAAGVRQGRQ